MDVGPDLQTRLSVTDPELRRCQVPMRDLHQHHWEAMKAAHWLARTVSL